MSFPPSLGISDQSLWITPEEQLEKLGQGPAISKKIMELSILILPLANLITEYASESRLTSWYTGLKLIGKLLKKIPPIPQNIFEALNGNCPKRIYDKMKSDGSFYTLGEKATLTLIPQELGNINEFERVIKSYGEKQYPRGKNFLQFYYFFGAARTMHENVPFGSTHWELQTDDVLEESQDKNAKDQADLVRLLAQETSADWQVPELQGMIVGTFIKKIATGESISPPSDEQKRDIAMYTRLKETLQDGPVEFGDSHRNGVNISRHFWEYSAEDLGVKACWKG